MKCERCNGTGTGSLAPTTCQACGGYGTTLPLTVPVKPEPATLPLDRRPFGEDPCACPHCEQLRFGAWPREDAPGTSKTESGGSAGTPAPGRLDEAPGRLDGAAYADLRARLRRSIEAVETWRDVGTPRHRVILAELREVLRRLEGA